MAHWRDSARTPHFFFIEGWAAFPMLFFLLHIRMWTFILALSATIFFSILYRYGFSAKVFLRWFRNFLAGNHKISAPWWR